MKFLDLKKNKNFTRTLKPFSVSSRSERGFTRTPVFSGVSWQSQRGFTLVELMVSVSVFSLVMVICMGSIVAVLDANRKSQNTRSVMDNLNSSLEGMTRDIRFGTNYHCGTSGVLSQPLDCSGGNTSLTIRSQAGVQMTYSLSGGRIVRNESGVNYYVTSPDIVIQTLTFRVDGSAAYPGDRRQPRVVVIISGYSGSDSDTRSSFSLETAISQRTIDFI